MLYLALPHRFTPSKTQRVLETANGYLDLGMAEEARRELRRLSTSELDKPDALRMTIRVLLQEGEWKIAEQIARRCTARYSDDHEFLVQRIFALYQMDKPQAARRMLARVPRWLHDTGLIHYNLACYEARLGDPDTALECAHAAFKLNASLSRRARKDPDLLGIVERTGASGSSHFRITWAGNRKIADA